MWRWLHTAIEANRLRKRTELSDRVREELPWVLRAMPEKEQADAARAILSASDIPQELIKALIQSAKPDAVVEIIFRDGSTMRISSAGQTRGGPGW